MSEDPPPPDAPDAPATASPAGSPAPLDAPAAAPPLDPHAAAPPLDPPAAAPPLAAHEALSPPGPPPPPPPLPPLPPPPPLPPLDDEDGARPRRGGRRLAYSALAIVSGVLILVLALLGRANARHYYLRCAPAQITAEQGRSFPPWGSRPLTGPAWRAIERPENADCRARDTESLAELGGWYLDVLIDRASKALAGNILDQPSADNAPAPLDVAAAQLDQAQLLAHDPSHSAERARIARLEGDVAYWRAAQRVREAAAALADARTKFHDAATRRPEHVADAAAWAAFLGRLAGELHGGPSAAAPPSPAPTAPPPPAPVPAPTAMPPPAGPPAAPLGTALPVEPPPDAGSAAPPAAPRDAGLPPSGVLM
jgi:hypothetical protein